MRFASTMVVAGLACACSPSMADPDVRRTVEKVRETSESGKDLHFRRLKAVRKEMRYGYKPPFRVEVKAVCGQVRGYEPTRQLDGYIPFVRVVSLRLMGGEIRDEAASPVSFVKHPDAGAALLDYEHYCGPVD